MYVEKQTACQVYVYTPCRQDLNVEFCCQNQLIHTQARQMQTARHRSGSVVSGIAFNVPILDQYEQLSRSGPGAPETRTLRRSNSFVPAPKESSSGISGTEGHLAITPLTDREKAAIWQREEKRNENSIDLDLDDELVINNIESNFANELSVRKAQEFRDFLTQTKAQNDAFVTDVEGIVSQLETLLAIHKNVTIQTRDFQSESTSLIDELESYETLYNDLRDKFAIFQDLESIVKRLNTANNSKIVLKSSFQNDILSKLDTCLLSVNDPAHAKYKDIDSYKYRFKQCMIRALTLIRNYLINYLKTAESKVITTINELPKDKDNSIVIDALINKNFSDSLSSFYSLFAEIYRRINGNDDYFNLLDDIYNQYFKTRSSLVHTYIIQPHMRDSVNFNTDLLSLANSNLKFFAKLIEREFDIFRNLFFLPPNEITETIDNSANLTAAHKFFESLLDPLYYLLRNKILRESDINSLCEMVSLLRSYTEMENDTTEFSQYLALQQNRIDYDELLQPVLEDTQTRLVFRIHKFVETNIVNYKKTGKELIISNKPVAAATSDINPNADYIDDNIMLNSNMIYPPIINSIKLLTKIYQLLNQSVFDDITSSIVHLSLLSLESNFSNISSIDCKLYEIRSLILFKEYINTFEIEHARKETSLDFSGLKKLYTKFLERNTKIELKSTEHESLFNLILGSIPKVVNDYVDCRIELQIELRNVVHEFIKITSKTFVEPLFSTPLEELTAEKVNTINTKLISNIRSELPRLKILIKDYIRDNRTSTFLLDGIQEEIQNEYTLFYDSVTASGKGEVIVELYDVGYLNKIWVETVKLLFIDDEEDEDGNLDDLRDIQKDIEAMADYPLDADTASSVVTSSL